VKQNTKPKVKTRIITRESDRGHFAYDEKIKEKGVQASEVNSMKKSRGNVGGIRTNKTKTTALIVHDIQRAGEKYPLMGEK
jgi:surface antigen